MSYKKDGIWWLYMAETHVAITAWSNVSLKSGPESYTITHEPYLPEAVILVFIWIPNDD